MKQGQFAKIKQKKVLQGNRSKNKNSVRQRTIDDHMATDFIVTRFLLTSGRSLSSVDRESSQRFLQELMPRLVANGFDIQKGVIETLEYVNSRVPWQFYYQLSTNFEVIDQFLSRELPVLPLAHPVIIKHPVTEQWLNQEIARVLARQIAAITLIKQSTNQQVRQALAIKIQSTIYLAQQIKWSAIKALLQAFPFQIPETVDEGTKRWLTTISHIHA